MVIRMESTEIKASFKEVSTSFKVTIMEFSDSKIPSMEIITELLEILTIFKEATMALLVTAMVWLVI